MIHTEHGWAPYMRWAKERPTPDFDLAGSNLAGCGIEDLPGAREALALEGANPDGWPPLIEAVASRYGVSADRVALGAGCAGANFQAFAALVRPGDEVLVERPGYDPLVGALALLGARIVRFDRPAEAGWAVDPERVMAAVSSRTRMIVVTSPHNPTGVVIPADTIDQLAAIAGRVGAALLVDEVYLDAVYRDRPLPAAVRHPNGISTSSLTKAYGLSSLRCGWVIANPDVAAQARRVRDVLDGSGPIPCDRLAVVAFRHLDRLAARARAIIEPNLALLASVVRRRPDLAWTPPDGGTVAFPRILGLDDCTPFTESLLRDRGTAVVPGKFFDQPAHIRIAFGCLPAVFRAGLERLEEALDAR